MNPQANQAQSRLAAQGYCLVPSDLSGPELELVRQELEVHRQASQTASQAGTRVVLEQCPSLRHFAQDAFGLKDLFADRPFAILRCVVFDKTPSTNWSLGWHQDLNIKSQGKNVIPRKNLKDVIALRLHLDPTPKSNGALRVIPGSHQLGPMTDDERRSLKTAEAFVEAKPGDILIMSPLLVHASSPSLEPKRRRIVHVDYLLS